MTKKTQKRRHKMRGGFWPFTSSTDTTSTGSSWTDWFSNKAKQTTNSVESTLGNISSSVTNMASSAMPSSTSSNTNMSSTLPSSSSTTTTSVYGGKRRYTKKHRGGNKLGLTYYATPVSGIKMAEPTYWIKGGKRRRRKTRKN